MASDVTVKNLGFCGTAFIDHLQVLATSGSISRQQSINFLTPVSTPFPDGSSGGSNRNKVKYTDGVISVTGSIGFDLTFPALRLLRLDPPEEGGLTGLLKRGRKFEVVFFGGNSELDAYRCTDCYATSVSASGSQSGIITMSVSFTSKNDVEILEPGTIESEPSYGEFIRNDDNIPIGYWYSGYPTSGELAANIQDWSLEYSQEVNPVYTNGYRNATPGEEGGDDDTTDLFPRYLAIGQTTYSLSATTIGGLYPTDPDGYIPVIIATRGFKIQAVLTSIGWSLPSTGELGTFQHSFEGYASRSAGAGGFVIE